MANTMKALQTVTVGGGGAASISFTNIPQTYTDLIVVLSARAASGGAVSAYINTINGAGYTGTLRYLNTDGGTAYSGTNIPYAVGGSSYTANTFTSTQFYISNYASSAFKPISIESAAENNATGTAMFMTAYLAQVSSGVNAISFSCDNTFVQYSTATLYGVFNADVSTAPSAPNIGTATAGLESASITFTGVSNAASYTMTSSPGGITATGTTSPITVTGLTGGTSYTFTCKANNPFGSSGESSASNSVTPLFTAYESIATITDSGGTPNITFSSIPSTYKHLQIRVTAYQNLGNDWRGVTMRFNGDSGNNYSAHQISSGGSSISAGGNASSNAMYPVSAGWSSPNFPGVAIIDVLDYASTSKNKTMRFLSGIERNTTPSDIGFGSGAWYNTSAITSITFTVNADNFTSGTRFALYGIKG
jgi:hypothetical protein